MTREETVSLLVRLLSPAHPANRHNLQAALSEILRTTSAAKILALQWALEDMQKESQRNE